MNMRNFQNFQKKANIALAWISAIAAVFIVTLAYIVFSKPMAVLVDVANESIAGMPNNGISQGFAGVVNGIQTVWHWWPILIILAAAIYVIVWAIRRDVTNQYY